MDLSPGARLGPYEILSRIGAGGMGEVFRARDTRLDRTVAIKVSSEQFSDRFEREARAVAALNHPHICTLYDVGPNYLVMEFVDGKPLAGPLPVADALRYAIQIAQALEAAQRSGIVHRDLKPANILVTKSGIKLLDFGLAKISRSAASSDQTLTMALTADHAIMGTLQYMSPEQLEGKDADIRSDIFAFGLVLYEMLTGRMAFQASSQASLIAAVLKEQPAPLPAVTPPALERIVSTCLAKDPDDRWQTARDLRRELEWATRPEPAPEASAALALALAVLAVLWPRHSDIATFDPAPLTWYAGQQRDPALSPDGKLLAFIWTGTTSPSHWNVYVKQLDASQPLRVTHDDVNYASPVWSPDGHQLAVLRHTNKGTAIVLLPSLGGPEREIARVDAYGSTCWLPSRNSLIITDGGLSMVSLDGGARTPLTTPTGQFSDRYPTLAPDGRTLAFSHGQNISTSLDEIYLISFDGGEVKSKPRKLAAGLQAIRGLAWAPDGRSLFVSAVRNSARRLSRVRLSDGAVEALGVGVSGAAAPSISASSRRMAFVWEQHDSDIFRVPGPAWPKADPPPPAAPIIASIYDDVSANYSIDGKKIAFDSEASGHQEIWVADADGSNARPITNFNGYPCGSPRWSPDGTQIAFDGRRSGDSDIFVISSGGGTPMRLTTEPSSDNRPVWSSDGKFIYFGSDRGGLEDIWKAPAAGGPAVQVTHDGGFNPRTVPGEPWIYYNVGDAAWRIRESGGPPEKVRDNAPQGAWAPYHGGIAAYNNTALYVWPDGEHGWTKLRDLPGVSSTFFRLQSLTFTPDARWAAMHLTTLDRSTLLLVENVR